MADFNVFAEQKLTAVPNLFQRSARLTIQGLAESEALFILQVKTNLKPNYQLLYSIGKKGYINRFSPRISVTELTGVYIPASCEGDDASDPAFLRFYRQFNITSNNPQVLTISYSGLVLRGYLEELNLNEYNQEGVAGFTFTMRFLGECPGAFDSSKTAISDSTAGASSVSPSSSTKVRSGRIKPGTGNFWYYGI